jgi:DNA-binding NarL/FixJ family response regulator
VLLAIGRPSEARAACARVHEEAIHCAIDCPAVLPWRTVAALAALTMGEQPDAVRLAREELELAEASGVQAAVGVARRTLGLATTDVDELAAAVHLLSKTPAALEHTRALVDLGASLRRLGSRTEARGLLAEALDRALGAGATTLAERAHVELLATGARPRSLVRTGVDALTPSELRVATLAAQGLTNREIAQHLFVAPKTAETHLYAAFRKLEIRRRADLGSALGRQSSGGPPDAKPPGNRHDRESR